MVGRGGCQFILTKCKNFPIIRADIFQNNICATKTGSGLGWGVRSLCKGVLERMNCPRLLNEDSAMASLLFQACHRENMTKRKGCYRLKTQNRKDPEPIVNPKIKLQSVDWNNFSVWSSHVGTHLTVMLKIVCFSTCVTFMTPPRLHVPRKLW